MSLPGSPSVVPLPRHLAVGLLLCLGCILGANHVAARLAFDHGAGVLLAVMLRSGGTLLVLAIIVLSRREPLRLPGATARWQLLLGLLQPLRGLLLGLLLLLLPGRLLAHLVAELPEPLRHGRRHRPIQPSGSGGPAGLHRRRKNRVEEQRFLEFEHVLIPIIRLERPFLVHERRNLRRKLDEIARQRRGIRLQSGFLQDYSYSRACSWDILHIRPGSCLPAWSELCS